MPAERESIPLTARLFELSNIVSILAGMILWEAESWTDSLWVPLEIGLVLLITRGRRSWARWLFTVMTVVAIAALTGAIFMIPDEVSELDLAFYIVVFALQLVLLWSRSMSRWIASRSAAPANAGSIEIEPLNR